MSPFCRSRFRPHPRSQDLFRPVALNLGHQRHVLPYSIPSTTMDTQSTFPSTYKTYLKMQGACYVNPSIPCQSSTSAFEKVEVELSSRQLFSSKSPCPPTPPESGMMILELDSGTTGQVLVSLSVRTNSVSFEPSSIYPHSDTTMPSLLCGLLLPLSKESFVALPDPRRTGYSQVRRLYRPSVRGIGRPGPPTKHMVINQSSEGVSGC